jgi:hypothetical protein
MDADRTALARGASTRVVFIDSPKDRVCFLVWLIRNSIPWRNAPFKPFLADDTRGGGTLYISGLTYF